MWTSKMRRIHSTGVDWLVKRSSEEVVLIWWILRSNAKFVSIENVAYYCSNFQVDRFLRSNSQSWNKKTLRLSWCEASALLLRSYARDLCRGTLWRKDCVWWRCSWSFEEIPLGNKGCTFELGAHNQKGYDEVKFCSRQEKPMHLLSSEERSSNSCSWRWFHNCWKLREHQVASRSVGKSMYGYWTRYSWTTRNTKYYHRHRVLNSIISCKDEGIWWEPDSRHADLVVKSLEPKIGKDGQAVSAQASKVKTPIAKPTAEDMEKDKEFLPSEEASLYKSVAMRAAYLAQDRPDLQVATRSLAQGLQQPTVRHQLMLKRLARYLRYRPRMAQFSRIKRISIHLWCGLIQIMQDASKRGRVFQDAYWWLEDVVSKHTPKVKELFPYLQEKLSTTRSWVGLAIC